MEDPQLEIKQAGNVAWNIRVNGLKNISPEHLVFLASIMERLADRERYVALLLRELEALPRRSRESKAMAGVLQAADLAREAKIT